MIDELLDEFSNTEVKWDEKRQLYYFSFYFRGERYFRQSKKWKLRNKKLAEKAKKELMNKLVEGESVKSVAFNDVVNEYIEFSKEQKRGNTIDGSKQVIARHITPTFDKREIRTITVKEIRSFLSNLLKLKSNLNKPYSNATLAKIQMELYAIFDYAHVNGYISLNPTLRVAKVRHNTIQRKKEFRKIDYNDVKKVIDATNQLERYNKEIKVALLISRYHGLRPSELQGLDIRHIDFENKKIIIEQSWDNRTQQLGPTKNKKVRINYTNDLVLNAIRELLDSYRDYNYTPNTPLLGLKRFAKTTLDKYKNKAIEIAGVEKFTWYDLRHNHATELYELGFKPTDIAERLGHDETETLNTYIIRDVEEQKKMLEAIQNSNTMV